MFDKVVVFDGEGLGAEAIVEKRSKTGGRLGPEHGVQQHPGVLHMHAGMPVETPVETRMQLSWAHVAIVDGRARMVHGGGKFALEGVDNCFSPSL